MLVASITSRGGIYEGTMLVRFEMAAGPSDSSIGGLEPPLVEQQRPDALDSPVKAPNEPTMPSPTASPGRPATARRA
jgi:hypothetical protein